MDCQSATEAKQSLTWKPLIQWPSAVLADLGEGVLFLEFRTLKNSLNREILSILMKLPAIVANEGAALVIGNRSGNFSVGMALSEVYDLVRAGWFSTLMQWSADFQQSLQALCHAPFPVVAAAKGFALGGGCEICLASDKIVAHERLYMGFPERSLGLIPSGGGIVHLLRKRIHGLSESASRTIPAGIFMDVFTLAAGLAFSSSATEAVRKGLLGQGDVILNGQAEPVRHAKSEALNMLKNGYRPSLMRNVPMPGAGWRRTIDEFLLDQKNRRRLPDYDIYLARRIGYVLGGGMASADGTVTEETVLQLEREALLEFVQQAETIRRIENRLNPDRAEGIGASPMNLT